MGDIMGIQCDAMQYDARRVPCSAVQCSAVSTVAITLSFIVFLSIRSGCRFFGGVLARLATTYYKRQIGSW